MYLADPAAGSWLLLSPAALSTETHSYANSSLGCPTDPTVSLADVWELLVPPVASFPCCLTQRDVYVQRRLIAPSITSSQVAYPAPFPCIPYPWALAPLISLKGHLESVSHWLMVMGITPNSWGWCEISCDIALGASRWRNRFCLVPFFFFFLHPCVWR